MSYQNSSLWINAFGIQSNDQHAEAREYFKKSYEDFRANTDPLLKQIAKDIPELTVHDISHIDALWQTASIIAGPDYPLNPAEAFVLGGAFLLHDSAMSIAAFGVEREKRLQATIAWKDAIAQCYRRDGKKVNLKSSHPPHYITSANQAALRELHAQQAERLPFIDWEGRTLLSDPDLREGYGELIGKIAHSHWWDSSDLATHFSRAKGAIALPPPKPQLPGDWTVDALKVACLLRAADAAHIDARRAPAFLRRLIKPSGTSADHWFFQERLNQAYVRQDMLFYTSGRSFPESHSDAWWLCFDAVQMIDNELRAVDSVLLESNRTRLLVRKVAGAERPEELSNHVETAEWRPVDTRIKVSDVGHLARTLGGTQLYGANSPRAPLRELIANSADSIRARRSLLGDNWPKNEGKITIRLEKIEDEFFLTIEDNGLGMSAKVLTSELIDFGKSLWKSNRVHHEWPGLLATDFQPTGKYGIGFFSTFIWGDEVHVRSRPFDKALNDGYALIFKGGLHNRPILRPLHKGELAAGVSTSIRVRLNFDPFDKLLDEEGGGLFCYEKYGWEKKKSVALDPVEVITSICPTLDIDVYFSTIEGVVSRVLKADEWLTANPDRFMELFNIAYRYRPSHEHRFNSPQRTLPSKRIVSIVTHEDESIARIWPTIRTTILVTVGGLIADEHTDFSAAGFSTGSTNVAARSSGTINLTAKMVATLIEEQADILKSLPVNKNAPPLDVCHLSSFALLHGADIPDDMPIVYSLERFSIADLDRRLRDSKRIVLCNDDLISETLKDDPEDIFFEDTHVINSFEGEIFIYTDKSEFEGAENRTGRFKGTDSIIANHIVKRLTARGLKVQNRIERIKIAEHYGQTLQRYCHILTST